MNSKNSKGSNFLVQGSILAIASIVSRIIGLLYRIPMTDIIGDKGNDYYGTAFQVYNIMLLISSYSLPIAVSKFISGYRAKKDYRTIRKIYRTAFVFSLTSGLIVAAIVFLGAPYITAKMQTPLATYALLVLAPALIILSIMGVLRGLFQGMGSMLPTALSQIIEQIVNAIVSILAAYLLFKRGLVIGKVLGNADQYASAFGACGGTIGTTLGALSGLLFLLFIFALFKPSLRKKELKQRGGEDISYPKLMKILVLTIVPVLLSTTIYNISGIIDSFIFKNIAVWQGYSSSDISVWYGVFSVKYQTLINVPLAIASAMAASTVPTLTGAFARQDYKLARKKTNQAIRFVMIIAIPCVVGMAVLAKPILRLLFKDGSDLASNMLIAGSISIAFYSLSTLSNGILQGINRLISPVLNALVALVLHVIFLIALMLGFKLNIYAVIYANAFYAFVMCILNGRSIRKYLKYKQEIVRTFIIPSIAAIIMGVVVYFTYFGLTKLVDINSIWTIVSIIVGVIVYFVCILLFKGLNEEELLALPKGGTILRIAKKLHLVK